MCDVKKLSTGKLASVARSGESLWLWTGAFLGTVGAALMGIATSLDGASKVPYSLWTSFPMIIAYIMFGLAIVCLVCAVRGIPFPLAAGDVVKEHEPLPPQHGPTPSAIIATAKSDRMNAP